MAKEENKKPYRGTVNVTAYGNTIPEVIADAKRIAGMPDGVVTPAYGDSIYMHEEREGREMRKTGRSYATVLVTPREGHVCHPEPACTCSTERYSLAEIEQAMKQVDWVSADFRMRNLRATLARRGGRADGDTMYTLDELATAAAQTDSLSMGGKYGRDKLEGYALQARKNRVFEAHGGK